MSVGIQNLTLGGLCCGARAATGKQLPSYIGSGTFASVLVELLAHGEADQSTADDEQCSVCFTKSNVDFTFIGLKAKRNRVLPTPIYRDPSAHRAVGDAERCGDLPVAAPELVLHAQKLSNLPHGQPLL